MLYVTDSNINFDRVVNVFGIISPAVTNQLFPLLGWGQLDRICQRNLPPWNGGVVQTTTSYSYPSPSFCRSRFQIKI